MKIKDIIIGEINVPLVRPFKTALREVTSVNDIIVKIITDTEHCGYGEAPPTAVITGDTKASISSAIMDFIKPSIIGMDIEDFESIMIKINSCIIKNTSAKAAVDMAIYDLYSKNLHKPLYKILGGNKNQIKTDLTISVNSIEEMIKDSVSAVKDGYEILKIKVGKDSKLDIERISEIRKAVGENVTIRVDANQGWTPKQSVKIIQAFEDKNLNIELVEQPVVASDFEGLKFVTSHVSTPIMADESVFSIKDAVEIIRNQAADVINIKLMKTGGIYNALKICAMAESYNVKCMIGCMLESKLSVSAAAHLACGKNIIQFADLDGPGLCSIDPFSSGGPTFSSQTIHMNDDLFGIGFKEITI